MQTFTGKNKGSLKAKILLPVLTIFSILFIGWGQVGHYIINYNTILSAYPELEFFNTWADSLAAHASDADYRKSWDPDEAPRHYIDIDNYPEFIATGTIPQSFDSLVAIHGLSFVMDQGILPWAIINTADSLELAFENNDMHHAMLKAADLGHYIADSHQPLHITRNYDGQYTNQNGVHSRYETHMIDDFQEQITYDGDSLQYIDNLPDFVFNMIYDNYQYVDSVLYADSVAQAFAGNHNSTTYYNKFWELAGNFTIGLFQKASYRIACVIYTEWINAGNSVPVELNSFSATPGKGNVTLNWSTSTEINNYGFEIQRSSTDTKWVTIGFRQGEGTSTVPCAYSFTDQNLAAGKYQYRLKQIDFNGSYKYSHEIEVDANIPMMFSLSQNYPNPFNPTTTFNYSVPFRSHINISVFDILGNRIKTLVDKEDNPGDYKVEFNASNLSSGIYFYRIETGGFVQSKKMQLLK